ncbi:pyridoxal-5'-phosphate-dependent protein subunit beta [Streptomyces lunaelactis]|uniref:Pyridoxal-5'-phosphate-dependent protein subunit beta n=1 Tax=Streptomyces lunaelactis TaxID=1535768 RepID=A0A2R4SW10_9ACTN|nr:threonine/serine dehydratase [Streptomyces lunaelactis]AVZ71067.1 pyridoxal-5'-phosphate-dependent protein subunit beta [Streptomyces lunaelactis]NUK22650.1 threonine/serine dehydratase [Streptomyces lunaelactis]NUK87036.1 threonine/serine dehydratase [Streptomyces lunaelactis]
MNIPTFQDVQAARQRIVPVVRRTPIWRIPGTRVLLKREDLQKSGSFKLRGVTNAFAVAAPSRVVTASSGNHGKAVAMLARATKVPATVVMTSQSAPEKVERIRSMGAHVCFVEGGVAERNRLAELVAAEQNATLIPSSDHFDVIAGQGTTGLEIADQTSKIEAIYVPVGGGGLLAGMCLARTAWHDAPSVIGVEPESAQRYALSVAAGRPVSVPPSTTIADGLRGQAPGRITLPIIAGGVDRLTAVDDNETIEAMSLLRLYGIVAEPSSAAAVAAALKAHHTRDVVVVLTGGNISPARFDELLLHGARQHALASV